MTGASTRIANLRCLRQRATGELAVSRIVGEGGEWSNRRLAIEPTGDLGIVPSSYLRWWHD